MQQRDYEQFKHLQLRSVVYNMVLQETSSVSEAQKFSSLSFNVVFLRNRYSDKLMERIRQYVKRAKQQIRENSGDPGF